MLDGDLATVILIVVWAGALAGVLMKLVWIDAPKALVAVTYMMLGWVAVAAFPTMIERLGVTASTLVAVGGLLYTLGALVYAFQRPEPGAERLRIPRGVPRARDPRRGPAVRGDRVLRDPRLLSGRVRH